MKILFVQAGYFLFTVFLLAGNRFLIGPVKQKIRKLGFSLKIREQGSFLMERLDKKRDFLPWLETVYRGLTLWPYLKLPVI